MCNNFDSILAFGDSISAGCELGPVNLLQAYNNLPKNKKPISDYISKMDNETKQFSYCNQIGEKFNIPVFNYSRSGSSNKRSIRKLIEVAGNHKNSIIVFGITHYFRSEFYIPLSTNIKTDVRDEDGFFQIHQITTDSDNLESLYSQNFLYPYNDNRQTILTAQSIADYFGHKIVFVNYFNTSLNIELSNIFPFEGYDNLVKWSFVNKVSTCPLGHPSQNTHNIIANLISDWIKNYFVR